MAKTKQVLLTQPQAHIHRQRFERDFNYNQTTVLNLQVKNFTVHLANKLVELKINKNLDLQATQFVSNAVTELYPQAVKDYLLANHSNSYPFNEYQTILNYEITYNEKCHLSTYRDNYTFTGGAHGTTVRLADNYNLETGNLIPLSAYFKRTNYKETIINEIIRQADEINKKQPGVLFEDYEKLIKQTFNANSYYLTKEGIVVYFGQYDIAPYSSGIQTFIIPYSMTDYPPKCQNTTMHAKSQTTVI